MVYYKKLPYTLIIPKISFFRSSIAYFNKIAHKRLEMNSRMPFGSFEQSLTYFRSTGALEERFALLPSIS